MIPKESTEKDSDLFKGTPDERPLTEKEQEEKVIAAAKVLAEKVDQAVEMPESIIKNKRHRWTQEQEQRLKRFSELAENLSPSQIVVYIKEFFPLVSEDAIKSKMYELRKASKKEVEDSEKDNKKSVSYFSAEEVPEDITKKFKQEKLQQVTEEENSTILTKVTLPGSSMFEESLVDIKITGVFKIEIIHLHKK